MADVTSILSRIESGDALAGDELLPLVYDELRKLAAARLNDERDDYTLQATALVHEAWLRLVNVERAQQWNSRGHFFCAAADAMRRILLNRARDRQRLKRGGGRQRIDFESLTLATLVPDQALIDLDEALERMAAEEPDCAKLVNLRVFAGMSLAEAANTMGMARRTADRTWAYARAWLFQALQD